METFEIKLNAATTQQKILGAAVSVVDGDGIVYQKCSGYQTLGLSSPPVDQNTTFPLGEAGTFITHIAALQCVDMGFLLLDEPLRRYIPELRNSSTVVRHDDSDAEAEPSLYLTRPDQEITLRHLLSNTSGLWDGDEFTEVQEPEEFFQKTIDRPGMKWVYSSNARWIIHLIEQITRAPVSEIVQLHIFDELNMTSSAYLPCDNAEITSRQLQQVERKPEGLKPLDEEDLENGGVITSIHDLSLLLSDLLSPDCQILKSASLEHFFTCRLPKHPEDTHTDFRKPNLDFTVYLGAPNEWERLPICYSLGGLVVQKEMPLSKFPPNTVTWNSVTNLAWAVNRERRLGTIWVTQFSPEDDGICVDIAMEFFRGAWTRFASAVEAPVVEPSPRVEQPDSGFETQTPSDDDTIDAMDLSSSPSGSSSSQPTSTGITPAPDNPRKRRSEDMNSLIEQASPKASKKYPSLRHQTEDYLDDSTDSEY